MNFYYCDACHYCFEGTSLPDRCPDCGKTVFHENPDLLLARADDDE